MQTPLSPASKYGAKRKRLLVLISDVPGNLPVHFLEIMSAKRTATTRSSFGRWCDLRVRQEQRDVLFRFRQVFFERLAGSPIAVPGVVHGVPEAVHGGNGV